MAIKQREVYLLPFPFGGDNVAPHYFIVLSTEEANKQENTFIAAMITTSDIHRNEYSFPLSNAMFDKHLPLSDSHVRMHLITIYRNREILKNCVNTMKEYYFNQLLAQIGDMVFNCLITPVQ